MLKINNFENVVTLFFLLILAIVGIEIYSKRLIIDMLYFLAMLIFFIRFLSIRYKK